jgi:hypothetical protein
MLAISLQTRSTAYLECLVDFVEALRVAQSQCPAGRAIWVVVLVTLEQYYHGTESGLTFDAL